MFAWVRSCGKRGRLVEGGAVACRVVVRRVSDVAAGLVRLSFVGPDGAVAFCVDCASAEAAQVGAECVDAARRAGAVAGGSTAVAIGDLAAEAEAWADRARAEAETVGSWKWLNGA